MSSESMPLYDMDGDEFYIQNKTIIDEGNTLYDLIPVEEPSVCPACGCIEGIIKHGTYTRKVRDLPVYMSQVGLVIHGNRFLCKNCGNTWVNAYKSIDSDSKMTNRMRDYIRNKSLEIPFRQIATELSITIPTVKRVFDGYTSELDTNSAPYAPRVLGIDENHLMNHYRAVFSDIEARSLIEILKTRSKPAVKAFILSLPDINKIEVVTTDMWKPYKEAVQEVLPNAALVIDKFHVIKEVTGTLEVIRKRLKDDVDATERKYLRNSRFLMLSNQEDLSKDKEARLKALFDRYPAFERPYHIKEAFRDIYAQKNRKDAEDWYEDVKDLVASYSDLSEFQAVIATIENWKAEIFNYFDHPYTNAVTENLNKMINDIGNAGRGYSFEVLRAKALYKCKAIKPTKFSFPNDDD